MNKKKRIIGGYIERDRYLNNAKEIRLKLTNKTFLWLAVLGIIFIPSIVGCNPRPINKSVTKDRVIKNTFEIAGKYAVEMKVEIEYSVSQKGYLNNECTAQYILTNMSEIPYSTKRYSMDIIFEFQTSDGKVFEVRNRMNNDIQPSHTDEAKKVQLSVGLNKFCISVRPVRIVSND